MTINRINGVDPLPCVLEGRRHCLAGEAGHAPGRVA